MQSLFLVQLFVLVLIALGSDVVILDSKNFEHLTQASSGATTGDWLVEFYAPWCGHCKKLEPIYDKVAAALVGTVNVAKVDVTANRDLGTRFEIKGFPTLKLLSKGKVYDYKGRRTEEELIDFARGGYQIQSAEDVAPPLGFFGEIAHVYRHAYKTASADLRAGRVLTINVFLTFLPLLFLGMLLLLIFAPSPAAPRRKRAPVEDPSAASTPEVVTEGEATTSKEE